MENAEENDMEDEQMKIWTNSVECMRMSRMVLLILIILSMLSR